MGEVYRCEGGQNKRVERREYKMGEGGERGGRASSNLSGRASRRAARGILEAAAISSHNIFVIVINEERFLGHTAFSKYS